LVLQGRLGLEPGRNGLVIPVFEELPSTVIAYALNCQVGGVDPSG
jgi:hypothetical protein